MIHAHATAFDYNTIQNKRLVKRFIQIAQHWRTSAKTKVIFAKHNWHLNEKQIDLKTAPIHVKMTIYGILVTT